MGLWLVILSLIVHHYVFCHFETRCEWKYLCLFSKMKSYSHKMFKIFWKFWNYWKKNEKVQNILENPLVENLNFLLFWLRWLLFWSHWLGSIFCWFGQKFVEISEIFTAFVYHNVEHHGMNQGYCINLKLDHQVTMDIDPKFIFTTKKWVGMQLHNIAIKYWKF